MTRAIALLALVGFAFAGDAIAQQFSVLRLTAHPPEEAPFQNGECLEIRSDRTVPPSVLRIVVVDNKKWPWVLAKVQQDDVWINFSHVVSATRLALIHRQ